MATKNELREIELSQLSHRLRCAVAAICVERIINIYYSYTDTELDEPNDSIGLIWEYAVNGQVDREMVKEIYDILFAKGETIGEQDKHAGMSPGPLFFVNAAFVQALKSISDEGINSTKYALSFSIDAVKLSAVGDAKEAGEEESAFHKAVLSRASSWGDKPISMDMFDDLNPDESRWGLKLSGAE